MPQNLKTEIESESEWPLMLRMSKVFADPLRVKILGECQSRPMSPQSFYAEFGGVSLDRVSRAFDVLVEYDWIGRTGTEGGGEHTDTSEQYYRAVDATTFDDDVLGDASGPMRTLMSWRVFESLADRVREAVEVGTLEGRVDQHFSWTPLALDQLGWEAVVSKVNALFYSLAQEQQNADARMAESDERPIPMTVSLFAFESPERPEPPR